MGLYPVNCPSCNVTHMWFSGNMDQRCEACRTPRQWFLQTHTDPGFPTIAIEVSEEQKYTDDILVIEKSSYDFQCKQVADMVKTFNESSEYYQGMIRDLQTQVSIEKGEVARLMAMAKRRNKR